VITHIRCLQDAEEFVLRCYDDPEYGNDGPVVLDSCKLHIRLDPGDGNTNRKIDRARRLLQQHVDCIYLLAKTGNPLGRLSDIERGRLSIIGTIGTGSTNLTEELAKSHSAIHSVLPAHWSHRRRNLVTVGALLLTAGGFFINSIIQYNGTTSGAQISAAATIEAARMTSSASIEVARIQADAQIVAARMQVSGDKTGQESNNRLVADSYRAPSRATIALAQLANVDHSKVVWFAASDAVPWRFAMLDLAPHAGTIEWNGSKPIPAPVAKAIAKSGKKDAVKQRQIAKENGRPGIIATPWVTEVLISHSASGAMRLGGSNV
jgi:hypothetical protein